MSVELKLRYNPESEEAEVAVADGDKEEVVVASGPEVFASWVADYNEKHPVANDHNETPPEPVEPTDEEKLAEAHAELERLRAVEAEWLASKKEKEEPAPPVD